MEVTVGSGRKIWMDRGKDGKKGDETEETR